MSVSPASLSYPFSSPQNHHAGAVHEETVEWAAQLGFLHDEATYHQVKGTNIGGLAGRFHPVADRERLRLISDFYIWMFFRDDLCDESEMGRNPQTLAEFDQKYLAILRGEAISNYDTPLAKGMLDLHRRLSLIVPTKVWMRRFIRSVAEHFDSTLWEATNRARGMFPDLKTYTRMRPITGGMYVDADLIEVSSDIHLPQDVYESRTVRALTRMSNNAVCWANDLVSLGKELASGDMHNIVLIIMNENDISLKDAIETATRMHDAEVASFLELQGDLEESFPRFSKTVDDNLVRYVSVLRSRMRGNLDWSLESARYR